MINENRINQRYAFLLPAAELLAAMVASHTCAVTLRGTVAVTLYFLMKGCKTHVLFKT